MNVSVMAVPANILPGALDGAAAIVIDALRMTSVAVTALHNGCAGVLACPGVEEAKATAVRSEALLGGERNALLIPGFDFSNSPLEYTAEKVAGRNLVMSTSNGTKAIAAASGAKRVLLAAFVNAKAAAEAVRGEEKTVIICAGTLGAFTLEDALAAGAIIERLQKLGASPVLDDMAIAARMLYEAARGDFMAALAATKHFNRLRSLGLEDDLRYCLTEDTLGIVPEKQADGWFR